MLSEAKRKPLYQPWNEEVFRADLHVGAMTPTQRWIYRTLLQAAFFHSTRPYLPDDDAQLWLLAGCESRKQWERNKDVVRAMLTPIEVAGVPVLSQKRLLADWQRIEEKRQALAEAGRKGGKANAKQEQGKCLSNAAGGEANAKQEKLREVKGRKEKETTPAPETGAIVLTPALADWIPLDAWRAYLKLRKEKRAKVTPEAIDLLIRKLSEWRTEGQDVRAILERSVMQGYTGLFPLSKENASGKAPYRKSTIGEGFARTLEAAQRVWGNDPGLDSAICSELPTGT
jgi:hypothetical protein